MHAGIGDGRCLFPYGAAPPQRVSWAFANCGLALVGWGERGRKRASTGNVAADTVPVSEPMLELRSLESTSSFLSEVEEGDAQGNPTSLKKAHIPLLTLLRRVVGGGATHAGSSQAAGEPNKLILTRATFDRRRRSTRA